MSVNNVLKRAAGFVRAERVYGKAVTVDGVTVIPAAVVWMWLRWRTAQSLPSDV